MTIVSSEEKCCICNKLIKRGQVAVRILVEAVSCHEDDEKDSRVDQWTNTHDWSMLHQVHVDCASRKTNSGEAFEYGRELNALPLDEIAEESSVLKDKAVSLKLVQGGSQ